MISVLVLTLLGEPVGGWLVYCCPFFRVFYSSTPIWGPIPPLGAREAFAALSSGLRGAGLFCGKSFVVMSGRLMLAGTRKFRVHPTSIFTATVNGCDYSMAVGFGNGRCGTGDLLGVVTTYVGYNDRVRIIYSNTSRGRTLTRTMRLVRDNLNRW